MARIVVYAMGYRGDVLPYVAVASRLAEHGHEVSFVCPREFHSLFQAERFACVHSGTDFGPMLLDEHANFVARWGTRLGGVRLPRLYFDELTIPYLDDLFGVIDAEVASADLVFSHPWSHLISGPAAERRGVPSLVGDLFPMLVPSRDMPPPGQRSLGRLGNTAAWAFLHSPVVNRFAFMGEFRRFRTRLGLSVDDWSLFDSRLSKPITIGLFSPRYQPRLTDWPPGYEVVGFTPWRGPGVETLPPAVQQFFGAGDPPVLVTLGTNAATADPLAFTQAGQALDRLGARGLFLTSNSRVTARVRAELGHHHGVWPFVPLGSVLGHCRGVLHAGGHGTNAAVLTAGLPSAVKPSVTDQIWHARRIAALGVGVEVRGRRFTDALRIVLSDRPMAERARAFGEQLSGEDGAGRACELLDGLL
jgi:UDP:flavonoid glycosyltransferase YjiC (YdhE family)